MVKLVKVFLHPSALAPVGLLIAYGIFLLVVKDSSPTSAQLVNSFSKLYAKYGYEVIFFGALLEALVMVNLFVPGAAAVALGAVFARTGDVDLSLAVLAGAGGALVGYSIDFALGYFGFHEVIEKLGYDKILHKTKSRVQKSSLISFTVGFIHPNIGALISLAAGILKLDFKGFFGLVSLSTLAWYSFWGILIFAVGEAFLTIFTKYGFVLVLLTLSVWTLVVFYSRFKEKDVHP